MKSTVTCWQFVDGISLLFNMGISVIQSVRYNHIEVLSINSSTPSIRVREKIAYCQVMYSSEPPSLESYGKIDQKYFLVSQITVRDKNYKLMGHRNRSH